MDKIKIVKFPTWITDYTADQEPKERVIAELEDLVYKKRYQIVSSTLVGQYIWYTLALNSGYGEEPWI